jgi:hypothetical protein
VLTAVRLVAFALIIFSIYVGLVYGTAAQRILRHAGIRYRRWDRGVDSIRRFCLLTGQEQRPWRGRVLRDVRRVILGGMMAAYAGLALMVVTLLIEMF